MGTQSVILDQSNRCIWSDGRQLPLTPKTFRVLQYLRERPNQLVTKAEILSAVWPGIRVEEGQVRQFITELRRVLDDDVDSPRYIQTVHGHGYRLIGHIALGQGEFASGTAARGAGQLPLMLERALGITPGGVLVGRESQSATLARWLERAKVGESLIGFVSGEIGVGKTLLVSHFLAQQACDKSVCLLSGKCGDGFQNMEPYLPVLDALEDLVDRAEEDIALLRKLAPTWLLQMTGRLSADERAELLRLTQGSSAEHRIREIRRVLDALMEKWTVVLWLEDLHWADVSTVALINELARQRRTNRLLILCTYRSVEMDGGMHPLPSMLAELRLRGRCEELALPLLSRQDVCDYINARNAHLDAAWANVVFDRTEGNPLFMVKLVDELEADSRVLQGMSPAEQAGTLLPVPNSLRALIELQFARLDETLQHALLGASIVGSRFSAALVAAALGHDIEQSEMRLETLARRGQFIRRVGISEWPDATVAAQYEFSHIFYQEVLYERVTPSLRAKLHLNIAKRLESAYPEQSHLVASELSWHFDKGRDHRSHSRYLAQACVQALGRCGFAEASTLANKALELIANFPASVERDNHELLVRLVLAHTLRNVHDVGHQVIALNYERTSALCRVADNAELRIPSLWWLVTHQTNYGDLRAACLLGKDLLLESTKSNNDFAKVAAHAALATAHFHLGEFALARGHAQQGLDGYRSDQHTALTLLATVDPSVQCGAYLALVSWIGAHVDQAQVNADRLLAGAEQLNHPYSLAVALYRISKLQQFRRDAQRAEEFARRSMSLSQAHGFALPESVSRIVHGWAIAMQGGHREGTEAIRQGIDQYHARGAKLGRPWHQSLLADALCAAGQWSEALQVISCALEDMQTTGDRALEAELNRIQGELLIRHHGRSAYEEAEACFARAMNVACSQDAPQWELRAADSLARLWTEQGKHGAAQELLARASYNDVGGT